MQDPMGQLDPYAAPAADIDHAPEGYADTGQLPAERGTRLLAALIDFCLGVAAAIPGIVLFFVLYGADLQGFVRDQMMLYLLLALGVLPLTIYQWVLVARQGQSLGKKWLGIRIVKLDGSPVGFGRGVALRGWVPTVLAQIPYIGSIFGLADALFIFGEERRCLHDYIAGTKVILAASRP